MSQFITNFRGQLFAAQNFVTWVNPNDLYVKQNGFGEGPFMVSRVKNLPPNPDHPQMLTIILNNGEEREFSGAWFRRY